MATTIQELHALPYEIEKAQDHEQYDLDVRRRFIKIAALAIAAVETMDRAIEREVETAMAQEIPNADPID